MSGLSALTFTCGLVAGLLVGVVGTRWIGTPMATAGETPRLVVRLHKISIRPGQGDEYDRWQAFLHARHDDAVRTLAREHMFVEAMFRDPAQPQALYWLEVRDDRGARVESSTADIDIKHKHFMDTVLMPGTWSVMHTDNVLVAPFIDHAIAARGNDSRADD